MALLPEEVALPPGPGITRCAEVCSSRRSEMVLSGLGGDLSNTSGVASQSSASSANNEITDERSRSINSHMHIFQQRTHSQLKRIGCHYIIQKFFFLFGN